MCVHCWPVSSLLACDCLVVCICEMIAVSSSRVCWSEALSRMWVSMVTEPQLVQLGGRWCITGLFAVAASPSVGLEQIASTWASGEKASASSSASGAWEYGRWSTSCSLELATWDQRMALCTFSCSYTLQRGAEPSKCALPVGIHVLWGTCMCV